MKSRISHLIGVSPHLDNVAYWNSPCCFPHFYLIIFCYILNIFSYRLNVNRFRFWQQLIIDYSLKEKQRYNQSIICKDYYGIMRNQCLEFVANLWIVMKSAINETNYTWKKCPDESVNFDVYGYLQTLNIKK